MVTGGSVAGPLQGLGRWAILRLLPRWLGEQVAAGGRVGTWPDAAAHPVPERHAVAPVTSPEQLADRRAAAVALRQTLHDWRAAERDLATFVIGSRDRARLQAEVDALRATHHRQFLEISQPSRSGPVQTARG